MKKAKIFSAVILIIIASLFLVGISGCRQVRYVERTTTVHDTLIESRYDSILVYDFHLEYVNEKDSSSREERISGDTTYIREYRLVTKYIERELSKERLEKIRDSILNTLSMEVQEPYIVYYDVPVEVERDFTRMERIQMMVGKYSLWGLGLFSLFSVIWFGIKKNWFVKVIRLFRK